MIERIQEEFELVQLAGFNRRLYQIFRAGGIGIKALREDMPARVIPDAYIADGRRGNVIAFEVERTSLVSAEKMKTYMGIAMDLHHCGWNFALVFVSPRGGRSCFEITKAIRNGSLFRARRRYVERLRAA